MCVALLTCVMQRLLSRHIGLVKLLAACGVVAFAGSALTTAVASRILLDVPAVETPDSQPATLAAAREPGSDGATPSLAGVPSSKRSHKQASAETIVSANLFCPTCQPVDEQAAPLLADASAPAAGERRSQLPLQLLATMESDDPQWSMATIRDTETNSLGPFSPTEQIRPGVTVLAVERGRVVLLNQGQREYIALGAEPPPPAAAKPEPAKPKSKRTSRGKSVAIDGADQAIDCSSENSCTVDRAFIEKVVANPRQLMSQARMAPVTRDGEAAGFRVSGVRKGSLATMLGLKNGDIVSEINGQKLRGMDEAFAMYQKLRRASHLSVVVERGGAVITKEISIK